MKTLSAKEVSQANRLLQQAGDLLNARGVIAGGLGIFEDDQFRVTQQADENNLIIRIFARRQEVMWAHQDAPDAPGRLWITPGSWQQAFLNLPAAHA